MAACLNAKPFTPPLVSPHPHSKHSFRLARVKCSAAATAPSKRYSITLLPGDGIGPEVISVAKNVLNLAASIEGIEFKYQEMPVGGSALDLTGVPLPDETLSAALQSDAVLLGAIGGGFGTNENGEEIGFNTEVYAAYEVDRIARVAFETARKRQGKLCNVDKANVLEASMFWRKRIMEIASEYPDVELSHMYVDNAAMHLVRNPKQFDTIVTNNIFGDILSDEASMITGSIGMLPSASLGKSGPGLFEPIHGSAPDIAGQDKANPLATVLSVAMLLKYGLGEENAARRIEAAVLDTLDRGFRTVDIYSSGTKLVGCKEMGEEVLKSVDSGVPSPV